jgi:hypothetical protein
VYSFDGTGELQGEFFLVSFPMSELHRATSHGAGSGALRTGTCAHRCSHAQRRHGHVAVRPAAGKCSVHYSVEMQLEIKLVFASHTLLHIRTSTTARGPAARGRRHPPADFVYCVTSHLSISQRTPLHGGENPSVSERLSGCSSTTWSQFAL